MNWLSNQSVQIYMRGVIHKIPTLSCCCVQGPTAASSVLQLLICIHSLDCFVSLASLSIVLVSLECNFWSVCSLLCFLLSTPLISAFASVIPSPPFFCWVCSCSFLILQMGSYTIDLRLFLFSIVILTALHVFQIHLRFWHLPWESLFDSLAVCCLRSAYWEISFYFIWLLGVEEPVFWCQPLHVWRLFLQRTIWECLPSC